MFCPECGAEYREGFGRCVDCEVDLIAEAPSPAGRPAPAARLVTVLRSGDRTVLAMAKSLLQDAGIASAARGEGIAGLLRSRLAWDWLQHHRSDPPRSG